MLSLIMAFGLMGTLTFASDTAAAGTPYTEDGTYDVNVSHVVINQVYGASDDGYADHSFIELYNPTDEDINLSGWVIAYKSSSAGDQADEWATLELTGTIPANGYYLIRCAEVTDTSNVAYEVEEGDQEWNISIYNKGVSVALFCKSVTDDDLSSFSGDVISGTSDLAALGYVDMVAVQGNDAKTKQQPQAYETSYSAIQSKKKAVRRSNYTDTDDNSSDLTAIDYSGTVSDEEGPHNSSSSATEDGDEDDDMQDDTADAPSTYTSSSYETDASLNLSLLNSLNIGSVNTDGGVAEIVAYNSDTETAYAVKGQDGKLYYFSVTSSGLTQTGSLDVETLIEEYENGFSYGDLTSVAVDTVNDHIALAVQAEEYDAKGRVLLLDYDLGVITTFETGVQPDMVTFTPDGSCILTADEGEPRNGYGEGTTDPAGTVTIIDLENETITYVGFGDFTADELTEEGVLIGIVDGVTLDPEYDLEPEYIAVSSDGSTAYVSLQEANAIAVIDIGSGKVTAVTSLGFKDYSDEDNAVDLQDDDKYLASTYENVFGVYMPDSISTYEVNGVTYIVTANEGDAREWGDYTNETKVTLTDQYGNSNKVRVLDSSCVALPTSDDTYLFGGRSFAIYQVGDDGSLTQIYESGNDFEEITAEHLSTWFNCSNDDVEIDSRSQKKGPEPEGVTIGTIGGKTYAFIGLERIGGIMVYDITDPSNVSYVNYINTRDFSEDILGDVSPEGLAFAVLSDGTPMLLAAYEVSGTVAAYSFTDADGESVTAAASSASYDAYTVEKHNSYEITAQQAATCTQEGSITYTCSFCNDTYTETIAATGHTYESTVTAKATCTQDGVITYTCSACGDSYTETIAATGHSYEAVVTDPTCTEDGYTTYTCSVCGDSYVDDYTDATGHSWGEPVWTWTQTDAGYDVTATFTCANDSSHTSTVTATVTSEVGEDSVVFTATAEGPDGTAYADTTTVAIDTSGNVKTDVDDGETEIEVSASVDESALAEEVLSETEAEAVENGGTATFTLEVSSLDEADVDKDDAALACEIADGSGYTIGHYLDISLSLKVTNVFGSDISNRYITDTNGVAYTITITVPEDLLASGRTYYLIHVHDGVASVIASTTGESFTFETTQFSTYAIAYAEAEEETTTSSGDEATTGDTGNIALWGIIAIVALLGLGVGVARRKFD